MESTKLRNKEELPHLLSEVLQNIKDDKEKVEQIKEHLRKDYKVLPGKTQKFITESEEELPKLDDGLLYLLTNETYIVTGEKSIDPREYFAPRLIKEIKTSYKAEVRDIMTFPQTISNVIKGADDNYTVYDKDGFLVKWFENKLLQWNPDTQREARQWKDSDIPVPKIIEKSVKDIEELAEKNEMITSMFTLNARLGSSDVGEELIYDEEKKELTITEGVLLDVLDGYHRLNGLARAKRKNPSLKQLNIVNILNYDLGRAKRQYVQINTTNPASSSHLKKMSETRQSDFIANYIQNNSELRGKVANSDTIAPTSDLLVTFSALSDAIDEVFQITDKPTAINTAKYLSEFVNKLFMDFPDEFLGNVADIRKDSLINTNSMIAYGYMTLAKRIQDEELSLDILSGVISRNNFSRKNKEWKKLKIVDTEGRITNKAPKQILKYFEELKIK